MPYLASIYGAIFKHTDYLALAGRGLSTVCAFAALGFMFLVTSHLFRERHYLFRFLIAAGTLILLFTNPLFAYTNGLAWNHDLPELLALVAFVLQSYGVRQKRGMMWVFFSGMLLGLATGIRVTFVMAAIPFGSLILLSPHTI